MIKLACSLALLAGAIWFAAFYKMDGKPLVGHLEEIYDSPVVQKKVAKIYGHVAEHVEKKAPKPRPMAAIENPPPPTVVDARPQTGEKQKAPAHDNLTEDDREGLNDLIHKKLKK